jgi:spore maturation protein A
MIGKIFGIIVVMSVIVSLFTGKVAEIGVAAAEGADSAVKLTISLAGIMCLWSGIMRVLQSIGLIERLSKLISPFLKILLPYTYGLKKLGDKDAASALRSVSANMGANILGIGNAATPAPVK